MPLIGVIRDGRYMTASELAAMSHEPAARSALPMPQIRSDIAAYKSPLGNHKVIDGKREQREDLARSNCRLMERGEGLGGVYHNKEFCEARGLPWTPRSESKPDYEPAPFERKVVESKKR